MRLETAAEVKSFWENHRSEYAKQLEGLTTLQRKIREQKLELFPKVECALKVFDIFPGSGTQYPHPLTGDPKATALITGYLHNSQSSNKFWIFKSSPVGVIALIHDDKQLDSLLQLKRDTIINISGEMTYLDEFNYFIDGGLNCFGLSAGSLFTFRIDKAKLLTSIAN